MPNSVRKTGKVWVPNSDGGNSLKRGSAIKFWKAVCLKTIRGPIGVGNACVRTVVGGINIASKIDGKLLSDSIVSNNTIL